MLKKHVSLLCLFITNLFIAVIASIKLNLVRLWLLTYHLFSVVFTLVRVFKALKGHSFVLKRDVFPVLFSLE